jgi:large subunit ribosomal protein L13
MNTITLDATNKKMGRVATEAAKILMGKNLPDWKPNVTPINKVTIVNASKADIDTKKKNSKIYTRYSGFPGGLYRLEMEKIITKKGYSEVFRIAIKGMLPKNKLQNLMMKNLTVSE